MNYYMASQNVKEILKLHLSVLSQESVCVCVRAHVCLFVMKSWEENESVGCYSVI